MLTTLTALFTVMTSGAGGGLLGGIFGLFKQSQERKERIEIARIEVDRDKIEAQSAKEERAHAMEMLNRQAELGIEKIEVKGQMELEKVLTESEAAMEIENQKALGRAQGVFTQLDTTTGMDNFRASVRPALAYWFSAMFTVFLAWAFFKFGEKIDADTGKQILIGMFGTLTFLVTSIGTFYYVSRRNSAPRL